MVSNNILSKNVGKSFTEIDNTTVKNPVNYNVVDSAITAAIIFTAYQILMIYTIFIHIYALINWIFICLYTGDGYICGFEGKYMHLIRKFWV